MMCYRCRVAFLGSLAIATGGACNTTTVTTGASTAMGGVQGAGAGSVRWGGEAGRGASVDAAGSSTLGFAGGPSSSSSGGIAGLVVGGEPSTGGGSAIVAAPLGGAEPFGAGAGGRSFSGAAGSVRSSERAGADSHGTPSSSVGVAGFGGLGGASLGRGGGHGGVELGGATISNPALGGSAVATSNSIGVGGGQGSTQPPSLAGAAGGPSSDCAALGASLHGRIEPGSGGLCRVVYDFSDDAQLLDWNVAGKTDTQLSRVNGLMLVAYPTGASNTLAAVQFKLPLRVTRLAFVGTGIEGASHLNAYIAVQWTGAWSPALGYGFIHRDDGRSFTVGGAVVKTPDATGFAVNHSYAVDIRMTSTMLAWTADGNTVTYEALVLYQGKDRNVVLGAWASTVAFDDVVIEGEF